MMSNMTELPKIKLGDFVLQFELDEPNEKVAEIARKELRENPDRKREAIEELKALLKEEKDLHCPLDNEQWLVRFLRPCKFYPESARDMVRIKDLFYLF